MRERPDRLLVGGRNVSLSDYCRSDFDTTLGQELCRLKIADQDNLIRFDQKKIVSKTHVITILVIEAGSELLFELFFEYGLIVVPYSDQIFLYLFSPLNFG